MRASLIGLVEVFVAVVPFLSSRRWESSKSGHFSLINSEIVFASRRIVFAGQLFSVWSAEVQKKTARHAQCVGQFAAAAARIFSRKYPFGER